MSENAPETLRSSVTADGQRIFLLFDKKYRIATRWAWLTSFDDVWDACDAFEAVEMMEGDLRPKAKLAKSEIARAPRHTFVRPATMARINYLINSIERRCAGLRPVRTGRKGSVEAWVPSDAAIAKAEGGAA